MPKISREGGASYTLAEPGTIVEDANGFRSALHPEEQNALPLRGEENESEWLRNKDGYDDQGYPLDDDRRQRGDDPERDEADGQSVERRRSNDEGSESSPGNSSQRSGENTNTSDETKPADLPKRVRTTGNRSDETSTVNSDAPSTDGAGKASDAKSTRK